MKSQQAEFSLYTDKTVDAVLDLFHTNATTGLDQEQITKQHALYGYNKIDVKPSSLIKKFINNFRSPFIYLLFGAALISFGFKNNIEGIVILLIILVNACIAFYQEHKADKALKFLKKYLISYVRVVRNGQEIKILKEQLVPGDIVLLYPGDVIPADVRIIEDFNITVDESIITGESVPVKKTAQPTGVPVTQMFEAINIGFTGTVIASGKAKSVVFAIGDQTSLGAITQLTVATERVSSFAKIIARFSKFALMLMIVSLTIIFIMNLLIKGGNIDIIELILFSAALAVSVVPEALPLVTTFALSQGAVQLARHKTVVKRLSAIEDLGNIEILCSDKTGTLTENVMVVKNICGDDERLVAVYASIAGGFTGGNGVVLKGFDRALYQVLTAQEKKYISAVERLFEFPFDPHNRRNAMIIKTDKGAEFVVTGAPEVIMQRCKGHHADCAVWLEQQGQAGYRCLAVAKKTISGLIKENDFVDDRGDLELIGMVSFEDPLKKTAVQAIQKASQFGIQCKILSGDAPEVCAAVGQKIGLITDRTQVMTGAQFDQKSEQEKREVVLSHHVFARLSPEQKYAIIKLLQEKYEVGYLGDGINDAPALKEARVALAVHDAADIARESADIILLEKSLLVIVNGIIEGRKVFANTMKYVRATLSSNFGNFYALAVASLFMPVVPMLPVQILLVNILSDFPLIALATDNVGKDQLQRAHHYDPRSIIILATILGSISTLFDFIFFALFYPFSTKILQTGWFIGSILTELVFIFSIRTKNLFFRASCPSMLLLTLTITAAFLSVVIPQSRIGSMFFGFEPISYTYLVWILLLVVTYFFVTDIVKRIFFKFYNNNNTVKQS